MCYNESSVTGKGRFYGNFSIRWSWLYRLAYMVDRLIAAGKEEVVVVDNLVTGHRAAVHPQAVFYEGIYGG